MRTKHTFSKMVTLLLVFVLVCVAVILTQRKSKNKASTFLSDLQSNHQMGFDSLLQSIDIEDSLYSSIEQAIEQKNFSYADSGITALLHQKKFTLLTF